MNIETTIKEMHSDFCKGKTLAFAEKLESLLDFADMVEGYRKAQNTICQSGMDIHSLGVSILEWPSS